MVLVFVWEMLSLLMVALSLVGSYILGCLPSLVVPFIALLAAVIFGLSAYNNENVMFTASKCFQFLQRILGESKNQ